MSLISCGLDRFYAVYYARGMHPTRHVGNSYTKDLICFFLFGCCQILAVVI